MVGINKHDIYLEAFNSHFSGNKELSGVFLVLNKYVTEWTSTDKKIKNLLNNAYLYDLLEENKSDVILDVIKWLKREKEILKEVYPHQEEEINTYLECLVEYEGIVKATVENGFSYYKNLVANNK